MYQGVAKPFDMGAMPFSTDGTYNFTASFSSVVQPFQTACWSRPSGTTIKAATDSALTWKITSPMVTLVR